MSFGLDLVKVSASRPRVTLVFVHGFGGSSETTWHHEKTGKTWIHDGDFLKRLPWPVRVFTFSYNSDVAANLSAASLALHAEDLLGALEQAIDDKPGRLVIFVAHGFGGLIVKRALQICFLSDDLLPSTALTMAGAVFFGTPHNYLDMGALMEAVRLTVTKFRHDDSLVTQDEMNEFVSAVAKVNKLFIHGKPSYFATLSCWEGRHEESLPSTNVPTEEILIPFGCRQTLPNSGEIFMDCSHVQLPRFADTSSDRFLEFLPALSTLIARVLTERPRVLEQTPSEKPSTPTTSISKSDPSVKRAKRRDKKKSRKNPAETVKNTDDAYRQWHRQKVETEEDERRHLFQKSLEIYATQNGKQDMHVYPGTCEWFKNDLSFKEWHIQTSSDTLFIMGIPGTGKTFLAYSMASYLRTIQSDDIVLAFFASKGDENPAIAEFFTWNLINSQPHWFTHIPARYQNRTKNDEQLSISDFFDILESISNSCEKQTIHLIIDGLEQTNDRAFQDFTTGLVQLQRRLRIPIAGKSSQNPMSTKVIFTCRPTDLAANACKLSTYQFIPTFAINEDIGIYIGRRLVTTEMRPNLKLADLVAMLRESSGSYWPFAKHTIDELVKFIPLDGNRGPLSERKIPYRLVAKYDGFMLPIFQSIDNNRILITALTILASSTNKYPFSVLQLESILDSLHGSDAQHFSLASAIDQYCGEFLFVDPDTSDIVFVHSSMEQHFKQYLSEEQQCVNMAHTCIKYLQQDRFRKPLPLSWSHRMESRHQIDADAPFYARAADTWLSHLAQVEVVSPELFQSVETFVTGPQYRTWQLWEAWLLAQPGKSIPRDPSPLHAIIRGGCLNVIQQYAPRPQSWLDNMCCWLRDHTNAPKSKSLTSNHRLFLPDSRWSEVTDFDGSTTLTSAVKSGRVGIVKYLLNCNETVDNINAKISKGQTALLIASSLPLETQKADTVDIVFELLSHGANPNLSNAQGVTALHVACSKGSLLLAQALLDRGAFIDITDKYGFSPLQLAYSKKHYILVAELISRGADVNRWFSRGILPLNQCILDDDIKAFRLLLGAADVNQRDISGYAPIHVAAPRPDRVDFLRMLLARPDLDIDAVCTSWGANFERRKDSVVGISLDGNDTGLQLLLEAGASAAHPGVTLQPLARAAIKGSFSNVKALLAHGAPINSFNNIFKFGTPLACAAASGHGEIVQLLLDHGADPTVEDAFDFPGPLSAALTAKNAKPSVISKLLGASLPLDVNFVADRDQHHLITAVATGQAEIVQQLLNAGMDASIWLRPGQMDCPLQIAAYRGRKDICELLLDYEPALLNMQFNEGSRCQTSLAAACHKGRTDVVRFLLERGACTDLLAIHTRESPLLMACLSGNLATVKIVLEAAPELINVPSYSGRAPLSYACECGSVDMIKLLLDAGADLFQRDRDGRTCVSLGVFARDRGSRRGVLKLLMQYGLDLNAIESLDRYTVLGYALLNPHRGDIRWLVDNGGDLLQCQQGSGHHSGKWRNALQIASCRDDFELFKMLLEPEWGLWEHLMDRDWFGAAAILASNPTRSLSQFATQLLVGREETAGKSGEDLLADIIQLPNIFGLSPVDYAVGRYRCTPSSRPQIVHEALEFLAPLLHVFRTMDEHGGLLEEVITFLLALGGHDDTVRAIFEVTLPVPRPRWLNGDIAISYAAASGCNMCGDSVYGLAAVCRRLDVIFCQECRDEGDIEVFHEHSWLDITITDTEPDLNNASLQALLESSYAQLTADTDTTVGPDNLDAGPDRGLHLAQSSLQLATLHAFGLFAIRRPLFSPYLPLSAQAESLIAPWYPLIRPWRDIVERDLLDVERSWWRRADEMQYMVRGLTRAYNDHDLVAKDLVLSSLQNLFVETDRAAAPHEIDHFENADRKMDGVGYASSDMNSDE